MRRLKEFYFLNCLKQTDLLVVCLAHGLCPASQFALEGIERGCDLRLRWDRVPQSDRKREEGVEVHILGVKSQHCSRSQENISALKDCSVLLPIKWLRNTFLFLCTAAVTLFSLDSLSAKRLRKKKKKKKRKKR